MKVEDHPDLEALVRGELAAAAAAEAHLERCGACREEIAWLRAERDLFARRREATGVPTAALWRAVEDRVARRRERRGRLALVAAALAAAAVILVTVWPRRSGHLTQAAAPDAASPVAAGPAEARDLTRALDDAEAAYQRAVEDLEADYRARRASLDPETIRRLDARFAAAHRTLEETRALAGDDPEGRVQVLHAYGRVVRGLQTEANAVAEGRP